jgi:cellulose synthase/poly-beta-1,6-N-acetylglucosamine synthase-like glycosyltransferase/mannose-6-phosphate isomerase-like protein (cupin superfamily)
MSQAGSLRDRDFGTEAQARRDDTLGEDSLSSVSSGLDPNISETTLERYPFISVHLPMFNEKRVAERLLKACTSFTYGPDNNQALNQSKHGSGQASSGPAGYEIVVADDSTDETTAIVQEYAQQWNSRLKTKDQQGPRIKVIHRDTREGFKGGALKEALKHTDKRAEFIVVFDADFVPYPDTLELFIKYFQASAGSLSFGKGTRVQGTGNREEENTKPYNLRPDTCNIAAVQGYQWHVLNKSENWITRGVRTEYSGSYVVERSGEELYKGLKQIAGSVYMVRRDLLERFKWGTSITEDFQLTLKLYEQGYKVIYTPYIQAPAECASTLKRLIRQRMRWAEGHSHNIRKMFSRLMFGKWEEISNYPNYSKEIRNSNEKNILGQLDQLDIRHSSQRKSWIPSPLKASEKLEFLYLSPYYLQAAFFLIGTISWLISETIFKARLPFWTSIWGWSLVLTNLLSLPLMNSIGLFLEEAEEKDFIGTMSFVLLSYILVPFQAYASVKGFIEEEEGPWFRTPKTGKVTDILRRGRLYRFITEIFGRPAVGGRVQQSRIAPALNILSPIFNPARSYSRRRMRMMVRGTIALMLIVSLNISYLAMTINLASQPVYGNSLGIGGENETTDEVDKQLVSSGEAIDKQAQVILTDNRVDPTPPTATLGAQEPAPKMELEEHNPSTYIYEYYVQDEIGRFVPYLMSESFEGMEVEVRSERGAQKYVFDRASQKIRLYEKEYGSDYELRAETRPVYEYKDTEGKWKEYVPVIHSEIDVQYFAAYSEITSRDLLYDFESNSIISSSVELKIGYQAQKFISKLSFNLEENQNVNRMRWETHLRQGYGGQAEAEGDELAIEEDVYDLREEVDPELEEYFSASLLGAPVTKQEFGNVEIEWEDFIRDQVSGVRDQNERVFCGLYPDLSLLPKNYPIRVEQLESENANLVYFYPNGKQGALDIDPTLALTTSSSTVQVDVANRYRMIMNTGDTADYMLFYDRVESDGSPDATHEFKGPCVLETNTFCLRDDDDRITTVLENTDTRIKVRVEGKMNNEASTDYLDDDGADDDIDVRVDYTFTTEGVFVENETDFKDGLGLDAETATGHEGYEWLAVYADVTAEAFREAATPDIIRGDGETETNSTNHANDAEFAETETYVVMPGFGLDSYQDAFVGIQRAGWYHADAGTSPTNEWHWFENEVFSQLDLIAAQEQNYTTAGKHYAKWFFLMLAEDDLDTEAEREAYINDYRNPDYLTYTTGSEWNDNIHGSPGLEFDNSNDYADMNDPATLDFGDTDDFTIEAWIRRDGYTTVDTIAAKRNGVATSDAGYSFFILASDKISIEISDGDGVNEFVITGTTQITDDSWHHVAAVFDQDSAANSTVYLNGIDDKESTEGNIDNIGGISNAFDFRLGTLSNDSFPHQGRIDEVRVWDDVRTATEIRDNMYTQLTGSEANLVGYWSLDEATGQKAHDETSNSSDGTLGSSSGSDANDPVWVSGYVADHYNEAEGYHTVTAANPTTTSAASQVQVDLDGGASVSTLANGAVTAETATVTVDSTSGFVATGVAYIEGDKFSYTGTTGTTFTGVPTSGDLAVIGHADNSLVSQPPRHDPSFKIGNWRDPRTPQTVNVEGTTKFEGTDYNSSIKPLSDSYFAQDLSWHSTLENQAAIDTNPDVGDTGTFNGGSFVSGRYGNGFEANADNEYFTINSATNFDISNGAVEFWYQPDYDHTQTSRSFFVRGVHAASSDAIWLRHGDTVDGILECAFWDQSLAQIYETTATSSDYSWNAGDWVHIRCEWDDSLGSNEIKIYLNGVRIDTGNANFDGSALNTPATLYIGTRDNGTEAADGIIDEIRFYTGTVGPTKLSEGGDTSDADEYLADVANDYTFDFNADDANNRGEFLWIGTDSRFTGVNYELTTQGVGSSAVFTWEYWNGTSWSSLTVTEGVSGSDTFETTSGTFYFSDPGNWFPYSVNGSTDLYYIRGHLESGSYTTDPIESQMKTDILLFQYLSDITTQDQTFTLPAAPVRQSSGSIQVDVPNRYRMIMDTGNTNDYMSFYDRAESDGSPDATHEFKGPCVLETNTYCLRDDNNRITTVLENTDTRIKVRVEGKLNNEASTDYLDDDGGDDDVTVRVDYTFTTEGVFIENEADFRDGLGLDAETATGHEGYEWLAVYADVTDGAFNEGATPDIIHGDGETETGSTNHANDAEFEETETYVVMPGTGSDTYQDAFVGIQRAGWYGADAGTSPTNEWHWFEDEVSSQLDLIATQEQNYTTARKHYAKWFFLMLAEDDVDTEAEREAYNNDFRNPDYLTYTTGSEWNDNRYGSPGLDFDNSNDYVDMNDPATLDFGDTDDFTIEAWVRRDGNTTNDTIAAKRNGLSSSDAGYGLHILASDTILLELSDGDGVNEFRINGTTLITDDSWHHIAVVFDQDSSENSTVYLNGVDDKASTVGNIGNIGDMSNAFDFRLGTISDASVPHQGRIDEVRVWDDVRTATEIRDNMYTQLTGSEANLVGYWSLDEAEGQTAHDETSNSSDGTLGSSSGSDANDPVWTTGYVPDHYNETEGNYGVITDSESNKIEIDIDGGSNLSTLTNGAITAESSTVNVDNNDSFASTGVAYIEGDKFSYTGKTNGSPDQFTGVPTSGDLAVIGHVDNTVVSLMNRHRPFFKVRNYRDTIEPSTVSLEGTDLVSGTDYNTEIKPITTSYFAQDLVFMAPMQSTTVDVGDNLTNSGCSFVAGRYGEGLECDDNNDNAYVAPGSNIDFAKGAIEFWMQPKWAHTDGVQHGIFGIWNAGTSSFYFRKNITTNDLVFNIWDGTDTHIETVTSGNYSWEAGDWVHFRVEWDDSDASPYTNQQKIFINGVEPTHTDSTGDYASGDLNFGSENLEIGNNGLAGTNECNCIIDEFRIYDLNGSGDQAALDKLAEGGDTTDADEYLADESNDYTFDFNADDASNRGEYIWLGSDSRFAGVNVSLATIGLDDSTQDFDFDWQYWNNTSWQALTVVDQDDGAHSFRGSGTFYFDRPGNWFPYSVNGSTDLYYIRGHLETGNYSTDPIEDTLRTDILLFQYLSNISSEDQTLIIQGTVPPPLSFTDSSLQIDVPNRYRAVLEEGDTDDFMLFYDRAEDDAAPDATHEFQGPCILETNTYCLRDDDSRVTTILESTDSRVRIRVWGKFNDEASTGYLEDETGPDEDVYVTVDYTFTTEGVFVHNETDFRTTGVTLDSDSGHNGYEWLGVWADVSDPAFDDTGNNFYGDGETETTISADGEFALTNRYFQMQGAGSSTYQDAFIGIQRAGWYDNDVGTTPTQEWNWDEANSGTQDLIAAQEQNYLTSGVHYAKWFFLMLAEGDVDAEAEREGYINDFRNPDYLTYTTGSEWDDNAHGSPGIELDGSGDEINAGSGTSIDLDANFSVEAWVKIDAISGDPIYSAVSKSNATGGGNGWQMNVIGNFDGSCSTTDGTPNVFDRDGTALCATTALTPDVWYHLAFTNDGTTTRIYVNGQEENNGSQTFSNVDAESLLIGGRSEDGNDFDGVMDEVRIWSDVRSQQEIEDNMFMQIDGSSANLAGYWRLNENAGSTAFDETSNDNDGTITNGYWVTGFVPDHYNEAESTYTVDMEPGVAVATTRVTANTSTGNQDITTNELGGLTPKAAIITASYAVTDATAANHNVISYGATTGASNEWVTAHTSEDGQDPTDADQTWETNLSVLLRNPGAQTVDGSAEFNSWIENGIRINWTNAPAAAYFLTVTLFAGSDLSAHANSAITNTTQDASTDITDPGFEPAIVIGGGTYRASGLRDATHHTFGVGFAHNDGAGGITQGSADFFDRDNQGTSQAAAKSYNNRIAMNMGASDTDRTFELEDFDSSGFSITTRDGVAFGDVFLYLALDFGADVSSATGQKAFPNSTGTENVTGVGFKPQYVGIIGTSMPALSTAYTNLQAATYFYSQMDETDQFSTAWANEDAQPASDTQSLSDNQAVNFPEHNGASTLYAATLTSFDNDGWTWNFSTAQGGTDIYFWYAIEAASGAASKAEFDMDGGSNLSTLTNGAITAESSTVNVDNNDSFPTSGVAYIDGDKFSYTGKTDGTPDQFTGVPTSGDLAVIGHADNTVVSLMNRHRPFFKLRNYRDTAEPSSITLEGSSLTSGTDYNAEIKPFSVSYFAQDLVFAAPLQTATVDVGSNLTNSGCAFVEGDPGGRYGFGLECDASSEDATFTSTSNIDYEVGALEFWLQPKTDHASGAEHTYFNQLSGSDQFRFRHTTGNALEFLIHDGSNSFLESVSSVQYSWSPLDWLHVRLEWDDTASAADQQKIFLNGVEPSHTDSSGDYDGSLVSPGTTFFLGNSADAGSAHCDCILDEFKIYDFNGTGNQADLVKLAEGGDIADADEYLNDDTNDFTFDFNDDDASNRGEYIWLGSDSRFQGVNMVLSTAGAASADFDFDWEFWDGTGWSALTVTNQEAGAYSFETTDGTFYFTAPGNWFPYSVNGSPDLYYIRGHLEGGSYDTDPIEDTVRTDILLFQYLSNITSEDQTFVIVPEFLWPMMMGLPAVLMIYNRKKRRYEESMKFIFNMVLGRKSLFTKVLLRRS